MTNKKFFIVTVSISVLLLLFNIIIIETKYIDLFMKINSSIFEPIFSLSVGVFACSLILLFFSEKIFQVWLRKFFSWFGSLLLLTIFVLGGEGSSVVHPSETSLAILGGQVLAVLTLAIALVHKFYYKR